MSREIELRAWLKNKKKMIKVKAIDFIEEQIRGGANWYDFDEVELIQYTGKKDKNETKIFEHDLIQLDRTPYVYEIVWDDESSSYKMQNKNDTFEWDVLELRTFKTPYIIRLGNAYENTELLGEK